MATTGKRRESSPWLYTAIVSILGVTLLIGVIGWFVLVGRGDEMPDSLGTIMSTIAGGLVGALTMGGPLGDGEQPPS